ncbi:Aminopeptidase N [Harpegnathos saltator]|uniref:Aminopeptidase N n=1 Tax=Harpegnathos saltator TaxID=610380 RepID=E2C146_HARSA|nr:Aminopeptidase N [Harpegnathos saltator]
MTGYYRVNYEEKIWIEIAKYLDEADYTKIHVLNRAQIIDDAYHFVMDNSLYYVTFYKLISYLWRETNFIPWHSMMNVLQYMSPFFNYPESDYFKSLILDRMDSVLNTIGYNENPKDDEMLKATRLLLLNWACKHNHIKCRQNAVFSLLAHVNKSNNDNFTLPGWKSWLYCAGLMNTTRDQFNKILHNIVLKNEDMLQYIVCAENDFVLLDILPSVTFKLEGTWTRLKNTQLMELYHGLVRKHARKPTVLNFILKHFDEIVGRRITKIDAMTHVVMSVYSECQLDQNLDGPGKMCSKLNF